MKTYVLTLVPNKSTKKSYILGVYATYEAAETVGERETHKFDASWWTLYTIQEFDLTLIP